MRVIKSFQGSTVIEGDSTPEIITSTEESSRIYDQLINQELTKLEIQSLIDMDKFWVVLSTLIKDNMNLVLRDANLLNLVYDADQATDLMIDFLSRIYGINFPPTYTIEQRRLILKYFPNFLKYKGIPQYNLRIINLIDRSEYEFYRFPPDKYTVTPISNGLYELELPARIDSIDFTMDLINRLTPEGIFYYTKADKFNKTLPLSDRISTLDKVDYVGNPYDENINTYDSKVAFYDKGLIYDVDTSKLGGDKN